MADQWASTDDHAPAATAGGGWASTDDHAVTGSAPAQNVLDDPKNVRVGTSNGIPVYKHDHPEGAAGLADAFWEGIGGKTAMDLLAGASRTPEGAERTKTAVKGLLQGFAAEPGRVWNELKESGSSLLQGHPGDAAFHLGGAVPLVGAPAQQVAVDFDNGDYARGFGHGFGLLLPFMMSAAKGTLRVPAAFPNANAAEAAAMKDLQASGVPVSAGAATGNDFVRGVQKLADTSPVGAVISHGEEAKTIQAVRARAAQLTADAAPQTPAETHYTNFRTTEADPSSLRSVPTGKFDRFGRPILEDMPMPVPVGILRDKLSPIYEEMQWMPAADRNASAGYQAVKKIVEGPDYIPASMAEIGLGGLKTMAREGAGRAAGLAKFITPQLQDLIDNTVSGIGGQQAVDALQAGRAAAAKEMGVDWLTNAFKKAEAEGGFNRTQGLWADWQRLRAEAKKTMFSQQQVHELNNFFLGVKKLAENPNPSGSGVIAHIGGQLYLLGHNPVAGSAAILGSGALSKLLHSPAGVKLLTEGLTAQVGTPRGAAVAAQLMQILGGEARQRLDQTQK